MNDKSIEEKVIKLIELNEGRSIKTIIDEYVGNKLQNKEVEKMLDEIVEGLRSYYIQNDSNFYEFSEQIDKLAADMITNLVKKTLYVYDAFAVVRKMELQSANELLCGIFDNCILRRDPEYLVQKDKNKMIKKNELQKLINAYYSLVNDIISKLLNDDSMKKTFDVNTGIDPILINAVTQKINSSFLDLKINYIINKMRTNSL